MSETRKNILKFRVNDEELEFLKEKQRLSKCRTMSSFLRRISLMGAVYVVDMGELTEMRKRLTNISANINQIARAVNGQQTIYREEIDELKSDLDEIQKNFLDVFDKFSKMKSG